MFPNSLAETPGSFVGIVLSSALPASDREIFKDLLAQLSDLRIQVGLYCLYGENLSFGFCMWVKSLHWHFDTMGVTFLS